jgi:hypothetical protein
MPVPEIEFSYSTDHSALCEEFSVTEKSVVLIAFEKTRSSSRLELSVSKLISLGWSLQRFEHA